MSSISSPPLSENVEAAVLIEFYRAACAEMLARVQMQIRLVELYGAVMVGVYSAIIVYGRHELLFVVGPVAGLSALWWADRQGIVIMLRRFLAEELEPALSGLLSEARRNDVGWYSRFTYSTYIKTSAETHLRLVLVALFMTVIPALIFCVGCAFLPSLSFASDFAVYQKMERLGASWFARGIAGWVIVTTLALFRQAWSVKEKHERAPKVRGDTIAI